MINRTGQQIEGDFFALFSTSFIVAGKDEVRGINGNAYRNGYRPRDSKAEDLVVIFTSSDADLFQEGTVTLNIYVPSERRDSTGVIIKDGRRCEQIEWLAAESVGALKTALQFYSFRLSGAIHTITDEETKQSIVVVPLRFKYYKP